MSSQAFQPTVPRSQTGDGADLPGAGVGDFTVKWVHAYGVMRIEVRAGQVYVDGEVVQLAGRISDVTGHGTRQGKQLS